MKHICIICFITIIFLFGCNSEHSHVPDSSEITNSIGMKFSYIQSGSFTMGDALSDKNLTGYEKQHDVTLTKGFYMQTTEVTQGQWKSVMGNNPSYYNNCGDNCPVETVSWMDVQEFIQKLKKIDSKKYRLPTEAEWEYACRAGSKTALYSGNIEIVGYYNAPALGKIAWYGGNSCVDYKGAHHCDKLKEREIQCEYCGTHPVGQKLPNAYGLYDMVGNVWEWCQDWYGDYPSDHVTDPLGPPSGSTRVMRGGACLNTADYCRTAIRNSYRPDKGHDFLGFRLVMDK